MHNQDFGGKMTISVARTKFIVNIVFQKRIFLFLWDNSSTLFLKKEQRKCISIVSISKIICQFHVTILYRMVITIRSIIVLYTNGGIFLNQEFSNVQVTPKCCKVKWCAKKKWHLTAISDSWYRFIDNFEAIERFTAFNIFN